MSRDNKSSSGLSAKTLLIAGAASAAATVIVPLLWRPGTLFAAAATPIIVALVTEALNRPVNKVSAVTASRLSTSRRPVPDREETFDPLAPPTADELARLNQGLGEAPPPALGEAPPPQTERHMGLTNRQWRIGIVTGLIAFVAAAAVVTASELAIFGDSVAGSRARTSLFGGTSKKADDTSSKDEEQRNQEDEEATPTPTPTETPEEEATPTPTPTVTVTPTPTPVPGAEAAPQAAPVPQTESAPTPVPTPAP